MNRGFVIIAENTEKINYIKCAEALALSIKRCMPDEKVSLITTGTSDCTAFDSVIPLPYGDLALYSGWKLINDWQVYEATPYEYTIKLEADMYIPSSVDWWWDVLKQKDVVISTCIRDYKQAISTSRTYRKFIDDNNLPDCYNALTYFKKSELAENFFKIVRDVFENWEEYKLHLKCKQQEPATTDWAYAIAAHILGIENTTLPMFNDFSMVHMKQFINGMPTEDWADLLVYEILPHTFRINTMPQRYPFHYHIKTFSDKILEAYS